MSGHSLHSKHLPLLCAISTVSGIAAHAADAPSNSTLTLEEVTVTAEKTARSLLDTAPSIAVFDDRAIESRPGLNSLNDMLGRISNVVDSGTTNLMPAVRGIDGTGPAQGRDAFLGGTRARLAYQMDGRPLSYNESVFGDSALWDVQQAEFLRGPQSSLQGRNSVGGLVAIKTKDPTYDWQFGGRLLGGNHDARTASFYVSGPLADNQLAFRLAVDRQTSKSWLPMAAYDRLWYDNPPAPDSQLGNYFHDPALDLNSEPRDLINDAAEFRSTTVRLKLLFEPEAVPGLSNLLTVNHSYYSAPQGEWAYRAADAIPGFAVPAGRFDTANGFIEAYPTFNARFNPQVNSATLLTTWELNDALTFESTVAYADMKTRRLSKQGDGNIEINANEIMVEPRLRFAALDGRLTGLAGVYYFHNAQDEYIDFGFAAGPYDDKTTTKAAFAEVVYGLTDSLDLTLGARYENEQRRRLGQAFFTVDFEAEYSVFMPKAVLSWSIDKNTTLGVAVNRGYNGGGAAFTFDPPFVNYAYREEYVWNYEAFFRANLFDNRVRFTANAFFTDYSNFQLPYDLNPGPEFSIVIVNAEEVQTRGIELGLTALLRPGLEAFIDAGLLHTEITKYPGGQVLEGLVLPPSEFAGNELARSPDFSAKAGITYRHPGGFEMSLDASYSGGYHSSVLNREDERVGSFWLANAQLGYRFKNVRLFGYVTNLLDSHKPVLLERASYDFDFDGTTDLANIQTYSVLRPRTFMAGIEVNF